MQRYLKKRAQNVYCNKSWDLGSDAGIPIYMNFSRYNWKYSLLWEYSQLYIGKLGGINENPQFCLKYVAFFDSVFCILVDVLKFDTNGLEV